MICRDALKLHHSELEFGFFGHHVFGPFRFENEIDFHIGNAFNRAHFLRNILNKEISSRTAWCRKRHINDKKPIFLKINLIDKTKVIDIDRNLRIVNRLEILHDSLFYLQKLSHFTVRELLHKTPNPDHQKY